MGLENRLRNPLSRELVVPLVLRQQADRHHLSFWIGNTR